MSSLHAADCDSHPPLTFTRAVDRLTRDSFDIIGPRQQVEALKWIRRWISQHATNNSNEHQREIQLIRHTIMAFVEQLHKEYQQHQQQLSSSTTDPTCINLHPMPKNPPKSSSHSILHSLPIPPHFFSSHRVYHYDAILNELHQLKERWIPTLPIVRIESKSFISPTTTTATTATKDVNCYDRLVTRLRSMPGTNAATDMHSRSHRAQFRIEPTPSTTPEVISSSAMAQQQDGNVHVRKRQKVDENDTAASVAPLLLDSSMDRSEMDTFPLIDEIDSMNVGVNEITLDELLETESSLSPIEDEDQTHDESEGKPTGSPSPAPMEIDTVNTALVEMKPAISSVRAPSPITAAASSSSSSSTASSIVPPSFLTQLASARTLLVSKLSVGPIFDFIQTSLNDRLQQARLRMRGTSGDDNGPLESTSFDGLAILTSLKLPPKLGPFLLPIRNFSRTIRQWRDDFIRPSEFEAVCREFDFEHLSLDATFLILITLLEPNMSRAQVELVFKITQIEARMKEFNQATMVRPRVKTSSTSTFVRLLSFLSLSYESTLINVVFIPNLTHALSDMIHPSESSGKKSKSPSTSSARSMTFLQTLFSSQGFGSVASVSPAGRVHMIQHICRYLLTDYMTTSSHSSSFQFPDAILTIFLNKTFSISPIPLPLAPPSNETIQILQQRFNGNDDSSASFSTSALDLLTSNCAGSILACLSFSLARSDSVNRQDTQYLKFINLYLQQYGESHLQSNASGNLRRLLEELIATFGEAGKVARNRLEGIRRK